MTPSDLTDNVEVVFADDEDIVNLENDDAEIEDIEPVEDKSRTTFLHDRSVFCVNFNSSGKVAVSGSQDDTAQVWNVDDGSLVLECTGHKDSVTAAEFSFDDKFVATGDMSGLLQVWDVHAKLLVWCSEAPDMEWMFWHHSAHVLLAGVSTGEVYIWQIPQGNCKVFPAAGAKCTCAALLKNGTQLAAGYEDASIRLWDLKSGAVVHQYTSDADALGASNHLVLTEDDRLLVTCGLSVGALVLKTADFKVVATLYSDSEEVETAAIYEETGLTIVATGCLKGNICLWDISKQSLRHKTNIGYSVTNMLWGPRATLFVGAVDGVVYVYNGKNCELLTTLTGHYSAILDMKLSRDSKLLVTGSDDCYAKIFELDKCVAETPC